MVQGSVQALSLALWGPFLGIWKEGESNGEAAKRKLGARGPRSSPRGQEGKRGAEEAGTEGPGLWVLLSRGLLSWAAMTRAWPLGG